MRKRKNYGKAALSVILAANMLLGPAANVRAMEPDDSGIVAGDDISSKADETDNKVTDKNEENGNYTAESADEKDKNDKAESLDENGENDKEESADKNGENDKEESADKNGENDKEESLDTDEDIVKTGTGPVSRFSTK